MLSQSLAGADYDLEGVVSTQELAMDIDQCVLALTKEISIARNFIRAAEGKRTIRFLVHRLNPSQTTH